MKRNIIYLATFMLASLAAGRAAVVLVNIPESERSIWGSETRNFDLNCDGVNDLFFAPAGSAGSSFTSRVYPLNGAQILMKPTSTVSWEVARLGTGIGVDGSTHWCPVQLGNQDRNSL